MTDKIDLILRIDPKKDHEKTKIDPVRATEEKTKAAGIRRIEEIGPIQGSVSPKRLPPPPLTLLTIPCVCQETLSSQTMS